jgi:uncharacterized protein YrzB (UPF0473 family)
MSGPEEDDDDFIVFTNEEGEEVAFEFLDEVEVDGMRFALMTPASIEDEAEIDVHIFKIETQPDGSELFSDDIDESMFERIKEAAEALFEGEDEDEE